MTFQNSRAVEYRNALAPLVSYGSRHAKWFHIRHA